VLTAFLKMILNMMLIGSILAFVTCSVLATLQADNGLERLIRIGALFSGGLVVLGAQLRGVGFAQFIVSSLSNAGAIGMTTGVVLSGAAGATAGRMLLKITLSGNIFAIRVMIFIGMVAATQFAEIYIAEFSAHGFALGSAVVPNIAFVVGILLSIALTYDPKNPTVRAGFLAPIRAGLHPRTGIQDHVESDVEPLGADPRRRS
jgi:hypothetical protein